MTLSETAKHPAVRWTALITLLVGLTQFNTGIKLVYSKWTADEAAAEAKKVAVEAKETAANVDDRFDRYIQQQQQAIETQNKIAEAIQGYAAQSQMNQAQQMAPAAGSNAPVTTKQTKTFVEEDKHGQWCCEAETYDQCLLDEKLWQHCP